MSDDLGTMEYLSRMVTDAPERIALPTSDVKWAVERIAALEAAIERSVATLDSEIASDHLHCTHSPCKARLARYYLETQLAAWQEQ